MTSAWTITIRGEFDPDDAGGDYKINLSGGPIGFDDVHRLPMALAEYLRTLARKGVATSVADDSQT